MIRKRILVLMLVVMGLVGFAFSAISQADGLGYVNIDKVFAEYKEANKVEAEVNKKTQAFKEKLERRQAELKKMDENSDKFTQLKEKYMKELQEEGEALTEYKNQQLMALRDDILKAIRKVAKSYALDMVVAEQVVYYGGLDITSWVIDELN